MSGWLSEAPNMRSLKSCISGYRFTEASDDISAKTADDLDVSKPVANRAIAPTGSTGILLELQPV